jgi:Zn-dependent peptidase ImmA (M78 family)
VHACKRVAVAPRIALVRQAVAALRLRHPELNVRPTTGDVLRVLEREQITLFRRPVGGLGLAFAFLGERCIVVDPTLRGELELRVLVHELGHCVLHVLDGEIHRRRCQDQRRTRPAYTTRDRCEAEAEYFTKLLLGAAESELLAA